MKNRFWALVGMVVSLPVFAANQDPVIMKIDGVNVNKSEFEYIYHKNNSSKSLENKSLDEYVELFVNYKLKVRDAIHHGYTDKANYINEFEEYKYQLAAPYLKDDEMERQMMQEAFDRSKYSILASHILVKCGADTTEAYKKINDIYKKLTDGDQFEVLASVYSDCPSRMNGGSLGYVNVFQMVYPFETMVYSTPIGTFSKPFRTQFGYHIVKTFEKKENFKDFRISHIMIKNDGDKSVHRADSLYDIVKKGGDFEKLAMRYSEDKGSASKGGDLGFLSKTGFPDDIIRQVKLLREVGEVTFVGTPLGNHIIKLTEVQRWEKLEDNLNMIQSRLQKSDRVKYNADNYLRLLKEKYGVTVFKNTLCIFDELSKTEDNEKIAKYYRLMSEPMFSFDGNIYSQSDFIPTFNANLRPGGYTKKDVVNMVDTPQENVPVDGFTFNVFNQYLNKLLIEREVQYLKETNPEFRSLLNEYSDGLLLFEISSDKIWNYAATDKEGLDSFFTANKSKYQFDQPKYKGIVVCSGSKEIKEDVDKIMKENSLSDAEILIYDKYSKGNKVKIVRGLYAKGANKMVDAVAFSDEAYKDEQFPYVSSRGTVISAPEEVSDVKGQVTADYQNFLEAEWIKSLRKQYPVEIYKNVLKTVK